MDIGFFIGVILQPLLKSWHGIHVLWLDFSSATRAVKASSCRPAPQLLTTSGVE